jgi:hypothetical protein
MEEFDKEVEWAMVQGIDPSEHVRSLSHPHELTEEQFRDLLAAAYSTLCVSTREVGNGR